MRRKHDRIFSMIEKMEADYPTRPNAAAPPSKKENDSENHVPSTSKGVIGHDSAEVGSGSRELLVLNSPDSFFAESCRFLRLKITHSSADNSPRTILITSALKADGKTFVASNLAASISQSTEDFVLLVDADLRNPRVHKIFGIASNQPGLSAYLEGNATLPELLKKTGYDKLSILPAGKSPKAQAELLSSERMRQLILELRDRYNDRYIIIDSAPLDLAPETSVIANAVDAVILVIRHGKTPRRAVIEATKRIKKEKFMGVVYNGYDEPREYYSRYAHYTQIS